MTHRYPDTEKETTNIKCRASAKIKLSEIYVNESVCPNYRQLLGKFNALCKTGECIEFYTINGKIKVKINGDQTKTIGHNVDLVQHFGEATMQAIEEGRYSRR